jgi:hypothetical protein
MGISVLGSLIDSAIKVCDTSEGCIISDGPGRTRGLVAPPPTLA